MTEEDKKLLNTFEARLRHFMYLHDELKHENAQLKQLLTEKNEEVRRLEANTKIFRPKFIVCRLKNFFNVFISCFSRAVRI